MVDSKLKIKSNQITDDPGGGSAAECGWIQSHARRAATSRRRHDGATEIRGSGILIVRRFLSVRNPKCLFVNRDAMAMALDQKGWRCQEDFLSVDISVSLALGNLCIKNGILRQI
jgi:hypothetical protein